jgi:hypothetical protein
LVGRVNPRLAELLQRHRVLAAIALLAPTLVIALAVPALQAALGWPVGFLDQAIDVCIVVVVALVVHRLLDALDELLTAGRAPDVAGPIHQGFRWLRVANLALATILALGVFADVPVAWVLASIGLVLAAG